LIVAVAESMVIARSSWLLPIDQVTTWSLWAQYVSPDKIA
jgi:hypothetical protein